MNSCVSECCSHVLIQYRSGDNTVNQLPYMRSLFTRFDREAATVNGRATYTSRDGSYAVSYVDCRVAGLRWIWVMQLESQR